MKLRHLLYLFAIVPAIGLTKPNNANNSPYENLPFLESQIAAFVKEKIENKQLPGRLQIEVTNLDARLRLPKCSQELELGDNRFQFRHRTSVKVSCDGRQPWSIYAAVKIKHYLPVVVAARPLSRGHLISKDSLTVMEQDVSDIQSGFFTKESELLNRPLKRSIAQGTTIGPGHVDLPILIHKGDDVVIQATSTGFSVKVSGTALSDGRLGRQIAVKNNQSNRIIKAEVIGSGKVAIKL